VAKPIAGASTSGAVAFWESLEQGFSAMQPKASGVPASADLPISSAIEQGLLDPAIARLDGVAREAMLAKLAPEDAVRVRAYLALLAQATLDGSDRGVQSAEQASSAEPSPNTSTDKFALDGLRRQNEDGASARVGPYRLLELLGEGGMGQVFLAEQDQPRRRVALKLMRVSGLDALRRFRLEAEVLGRLEHPHIARIYESGVAQAFGLDLYNRDLPAGLQTPYLAMEYVPGLELFAHGTRAKLNLRAKLELLASIAEAVHHAHLRGVVHRDLKPTNILIDERGEPKILDFGIAHVLQEGGSSAQSPRMTREGQLMGTLAYMSPEQLLGTQTHVDVRTDVYALGVIAYEWLCSTLPYPIDELSTLALIRCIDETDPEPISKVRPDVPGDLSMAIMKALDKDLLRRYASAGEFADDLRRFLANEPVRARAPTLSYVVKKFVRRNRLLVASSALIALTLFGASLVSYQSAQAAKHAQREAENKTQEVLAVNEFVESMLLSADPERADGRTLSMEEFLDGARISMAELSRAPQAQARVASLVGQVYSRLDQSSSAIALYEQAQNANLRAPKPSSELTVELEIFRAIEHVRQDKVALALASLPPLCQRVASDFSVNHRLFLVCNSALAQAWDARGDAEKSIAVATNALAKGGSRLQFPDARADLEFNLAHSYIQIGEGVKGEALLRELLRFELTRNAPESATVLGTKKALGQALQRQNRLPEAIALYREVALGRVKLYGSSNPSTLRAKFQLAAGLVSAKEFTEAQPILEEVVQLAENRPSTRGDYFAALNVLAQIFRQTQRLPQAEANYRKVLAMEAQTGELSSDTLMARGGLAMVLTESGKLSEAQGIFAEAIKIAPGVMGDNHIYLATLASSAAECAIQQKDRLAALQLLNSAVPKLLSNYGAQHPRTIEAQSRLVRAQALR
jgi:eukaryotic-like serine/threonine-protein kinase